MLDIGLAVLLAAWVLATAVVQLPGVRRRPRLRILVPSWSLFLAPIAFLDLELEVETEDGWRPLEPPRASAWERLFGLDQRRRKVLGDVVWEIVAARRQDGQAASASRGVEVLRAWVEGGGAVGSRFRVRALSASWPAGRSRTLVLSDPAPASSSR